MKSVLVLTALAAAAIGPASAQDLAAEALQAIGESSTAAGKASPQISVFKRGPCGTAADVYLCGQFRPTELFDRDATITTPKLKVKAAKGATVIVSWTGSLYCPMAFQSVTAQEYVVNLQIQRGEARAITPNLDSVSFGRGFVASADAKGSNMFDMWPVTVSRVFKADKTSEEYFLQAYWELRNGSSTCNLNGGSMTAIVIK